METRRGVPRARISSKITSRISRGSSRSSASGGSRSSATPPAAASCRCSPGLHPELVERLVVEDVGPERPQDIADAFARRVQQEANGWASEDELVAQLVMQNRRTPEPLLRTYAHFGLKPQANGRLVWKRDPNLVKGFVSTELWAQVSKITSPTLYVIGGGSRIVPAETQQRLKQTLRDCEIVTMPGLGHYPDEEDTPGFLVDPE